MLRCQLLYYTPFLLHCQLLSCARFRPSSAKNGALPGKRAVKHSYDFFLLVDDNLLCCGALHRLWTRFSAEKPRRLQVSTGHLPSAAFRVRYLNTIPKQKSHPGWDDFFLLVDDNFLCCGALHRLWTRFSAEKPRRLQVSTGHLPSAAFRVRYLNTIPKQKSHPGWDDFFLLVDDNGLEPLTLRTSSACSTS